MLLYIVATPWTASSPSTKMPTRGSSKRSGKTSRRKKRAFLFSRLK